MQVFFALNIFLLVLGTGLASDGSVLTIPLTTVLKLAAILPLVN